MTHWLIGCALLSVTCVSAQHTDGIPKAILDNLPPVDSTFLAKTFPIIRSATCANVNAVEYTGTIVEQSSHQVHCGILCLSGTMKVQLDPYGQDVLYMLVPCFVHHDEDLERRITLKASCLEWSRDIGCYASVYNAINSCSAPFHYCEEWKVLPY